MFGSWQPGVGSPTETTPPHANIDRSEFDGAAVLEQFETGVTILSLYDWRMIEKDWLRYIHELRHQTREESRPPLLFDHAQEERLATDILCVADCVNAEALAERLVPERRDEFAAYGALLAMFRLENCEIDIPRNESGQWVTIGGAAALQILVLSDIEFSLEMMLFEVPAGDESGAWQYVTPRLTSRQRYEQVQQQERELRQRDGDLIPSNKNEILMHLQRSGKRYPNKRM